MSIRALAKLSLLLLLTLGTQLACVESTETPEASEPAPAVERPAPAPEPAPAVERPTPASEPAPASERPAPAPAKPMPDYQAGKHYQVLENPATTEDPGKIEVMEVFWYGCSHCYQFEPVIAQWKKTIADDVHFARTPAVWQPAMRTHAQVYYATQVLDAPDAIQGDIFALLAESPSLEDHNRFAQIFERHGISREDYLKAVDSFGVKSKVSQGEKRASKNYKVQGTPELIVNGKYRISGRMAGSQAAMLSVADYLVDLERKK